jgi:hypothetical protein
MRTVTVKSILDAVTRKLGLDPLRNLNDDLARALLTYIHERTQDAWERYDWLDLTNYEQRAFAPDVDSVTNYNTGAVVYNPPDGNYYSSISGGIGSVTDFPANWTLTTPSPKVIPFIQPGKTEIATVFGVFATDPRATACAIPVDYAVTSRGVELFTSCRNTVWLEFRIPFPGIGIDPWSSTVAYSAGDVVYFAGNSYTALLGSTNVTPVNGLTWQLFLVPKVLQNFIKSAAYGDAITEDGRAEQALAEYQKAENYLLGEYDKQTTQQGAVHTYGAIHVVA